MSAERVRGSSDNPDELFDLVDEYDRVIGQVRRGDAHADRALMHRSIQVLIFSTEGRLLLQRRSRSKDLFPGYYCASASGHVDAGESYEATARREVREELGVAADLRYLGKTVVYSECETEITAIYSAQCDGPFRFHPTETDGGAFFSLDEVRAGRSNGTLALTPALLAALDELDARWREGLVPDPIATP